jgi:acyl-CoA reductase-like NAD-dependent aldehyde dehydrogenase
MASTPLLIGHEWKRTATTAPIFNPFTGKLVGEVHQAGPDEAEAATMAAVSAFQPMRRLSSHARARALAALASQLTTRQETFAQTITAESGKPITDARREVTRAIHTFVIAAEEAKRISGEVLPLDWTPGTESYVGLTRRVPVGPILGITPFNFPLNLVVHKLAPALAAGNPIVIKPAPQTPLTALLLGELILQTDLPAGAVSIVPCGNDIAERMVTDARFTLLSFTGSAAVGWKLKAKCGKKKVVLELGGNAGVIVEPDADLDLAAQRCVAGGFAYSGQTCISVQRIYVHAAVYDRFLEKLVSNVRLVQAGDPTEQTTMVGPVIDQAAALRIEEWMREAVAQGAHIKAGGTRSGALLEPTVLTDVSPSMKVSCQELFGPLLTVTPYTHFEEGLAALNHSEYGLQAGVFTQDINKIFQAYRELEVGAVLANEIPTFRADHMPYGGVKESGLGREGVRYAIEDMTELKLLVLNLKESPPR